MTNRQAKKLILAKEREYRGRNETRWYSTIHPKRNGEAKIRTWAVKTWRKKPLIMLAAEYHTDGAQAHISGRCLVHNFTNARMFNWLDYGGRSHVAVWSDVDGLRNEWLEAYDHEFGARHEFFGTFLNGLENTKYRYCAWEKTDMRITDFMDCYKVSPMSELLAKAGLHRWLTPSHVARLAANKPLARFVARHSADLAYVPPSVVYRAFAKDGDRTDVEDISALAILTPYGLANIGIAPKRILAWMKRKGVGADELRHHVDNLNELKMSTTYEPHVLPHDWQTYSLAIAERVQEEREIIAERERKIVSEARSAARRIIDAWMESGKIRKAYKVVIPASETELVNEGNAMNNCVGTYWNRIRNGSTELVFIRKMGKPYIDLEVKDGRIVQMRYNHNRAVGENTADGRLCMMISKAFKKRKVA